MLCESTSAVWESCEVLYLFKACAFMFTCLKLMYPSLIDLVCRFEGLTGFYKGVVPNLLR